MCRGPQSWSTIMRTPPSSTPFPYTTLFRSHRQHLLQHAGCSADVPHEGLVHESALRRGHRQRDRKSTRLNSSHTVTSYAVFCLQKKTAQLECAHAPRLHRSPHSVDHLAASA